MSKLYALVMAGGRGTRFWPESTSKMPKQYLDLLGAGDSLLAKTLKRFDGVVDASDRFIVTVKEQQEHVDRESNGLIGASGVIFEPAGRNTAPCILLSLATLIKSGARPDDVVAIVPSDHVILDTKGFGQTINQAADIAREMDMIVTIGIPPTFAHTGFGYIHRGEELPRDSYKVQSFKEKPIYEIALSYVQTGEYYWNAGMFVGKLSTLVQEFEHHVPEMSSHFESLVDSIGDFDRVEAIYSKLDKISIDYAIMEKSSRVATIPARFDWNDLGSWDALEDVIDKTDDNTLVTSDGHYFENSSGNIVFTPDRFVSLINVNELIVISNDKSVVVVPKKDAQKVKNITEYLKDHELGDKLL